MGLERSERERVRKAAIEAILGFSGYGYGSPGFLSSIEKYAKDDDQFVKTGATKALNNYGLSYSEKDGRFMVDEQLMRKKFESSKLFERQTTIPSKSAGGFSLKQLLPFKSLTTQEKTIRLVNSIIKKQMDPAMLTKQKKEFKDFYKSSSIADKIKIINAAAKHIMANRDKVSPKLFSMFFYDVLHETETPRRIIDNMQRNIANDLQRKGVKQITVPAAVLMNAVILPALDNLNRNAVDTIDINAVLSELSQLVVDLTVADSLHQEKAFISAVHNNKILSEHINTYNIQASNLYRLIISELAAKASYLTKNFIAKLIKRELDEIDSSIDTAQAAAELTPYFTDNLSGLSGLIEDKRFIVSMFAFSETLRKSSIGKEETMKFFANIDKILINNIALRLAFQQSFLSVKADIEKLDLGIDAEKTAGVLLPVMVRAALLEGAENEYEKITADAEYRKFHSALETYTEELRMASITTLVSFSEEGAGTDRLVSYLKEYLNTAGTGISTDLKENEKEKIMAVIENLSKGKNTAKSSTSKLNVTDSKQSGPRPFAVIDDIVGLTSKDLPLVGRSKPNIFKMMRLIGSSI